MGHLGLKVSPYLRTSVAHIYAAGDAAGNTQLTPVAAYEGRLAARNALEGDRIAADERIVPQTVFTTPEIAKVGLTHREVEASGVRCHVATHDMRGASNGRATGEDDGYLKLVFDAADERLLGVQMVVPDDAPAGALGQQEDPQGCLWLASSGRRDSLAGRGLRQNCAR